EFSQGRRNRASGFLAELVTADAADVLHLLQPVALREFFRNVALAAELGRGRNLYHRVPIDGGIIMRRGGVVWRNRCREVERLAGLAIDLWRVDEAIAAHPNFVFGLRQIGNQIAAGIVGDDNRSEE